MHDSSIKVKMYQANAKKNFFPFAQLFTNVIYPTIVWCLSIINCSVARISTRRVGA